MATHFASFAILIITWVAGIAYYLDVRMLARQDKLVVELLLLFLAVLLVLRTISTVRDFIKFRAEEHAAEKKSLSEFFVEIFRSKRAVFLAVTAPYVALFPQLGFFVSSFIYVLIANILLGTRGKTKLILIPLCLVVATYLLFVLALGIRLPRGILI